jgi:hypothetical protein
MASGDPPEHLADAERARRLTLALEAIETRLEAIGQTAGPDAVAVALGEPVKAFDAAAREALG